MNKVYNGFSKSSGVYQIINKVNGHVYFGQAVQLATRVQQHEYSLNKNKHENKHLQHAWNKYGSDAFEFTVLGVYPDKTERNAAEQALITEFFGENCYNMMKTVLPAPGTWSHTPEETRAKKSANMKGNTWNKGLKHSPETSAKKSANMKGNTWNIGKKRSPEQCAAMTGKKRSPETIAKCIAAMTGKKRSPEACAAIKAGWVKRRAKAILVDNLDKQ